MEEYVNNYLNEYMKYIEDSIVDVNMSSLYCELDKLFDIFININKIEDKNYTKMDILKLFSLVQDFFNDIKLDVDAHKLVSDGTVDMLFETEDYMPQMDGTFRCHNGIKTIDVDAPGDIRCAIVLVHEILHYLNYPNKDVRDKESVFYTEAVSSLYELLFIDYLDKINYKEDAYNLHLYELDGLRHYAIELYEERYAIVYNRYGNINKDNVSELFNVKYYEDSLEDLYNRIKRKEFNIDFTIRHYLGLLFGMSLYMDYLNNILSIDDLKKLNEDINKLDIDSIIRKYHLDEEHIIENVLEYKGMLEKKRKLK